MAHADHPNILVIHADQHRADCLGAYGNPDVPTPNLDALAADGVLYSNSFCPFPICTPSRYSLLAGLYVHQHGGWTNHATLPPQLPTFPRLLRAAGYRTAAVGKMHFTPTYLDVGFDIMRLAEQDGPGRHDDDYHRYLRAHGLADRLDLMDQVREYRGHAPAAYWETFGAVRSDLPEEHHSTTWVAEQAMDILSGWETGGNLLMVGFVKPHHPFDPPAPWDRAVDPDALHLLPGWTETCLERDIAFNAGYFSHQDLSEAALRRVMAHYYGTIAQIDHHVGRMIAALQARSLYENTLILYTSDHGDYMGFHHLLLKANHMYDPLVRVPLIVKWPGRARAGETSAALVNNIDVAPTLVRQAGLEPPADWPGRDLATDRAGHPCIFATGWRGAEHMARSATRKLLASRDPAHSHFFDLEEDPLEMRDLLSDPGRRDEVAELERALARWSLFDAITPTCLDERAPIAPGENAVPFSPSRRAESEAYFRQAMTNAAGRVYRTDAR